MPIDLETLTAAVEWRTGASRRSKSRSSLERAAGSRMWVTLYIWHRRFATGQVSPWNMIPDENQAAFCAATGIPAYFVPSPSPEAP